MKKLIFITPLLFIIIFIVFIGGYRFTALSAAKSLSFLSKNAELMEQYETDSSVISLFRNNEEQVYQTVLSEKSGVFFRGSVSTNISYSSDKVQTVGGISASTENDAVTLLSVISYDEDVAYIEAGVEPNVERKAISKGERISFLFPFNEQLDFLNPTAFNKEGKKLYYYGYPKNTIVFKIEDYKWHKIDENE
ncbi:hypothetical protein [Mesobacillus jeotgali]|uniref:hypothetical protein n=1 Tax=Mesobacillus jeotgali TaxID=129985 RepID=UPI00177D0479|nr:hypothetical protein [Mesobacillus jeotgali]UYZ22893.1 hypothetical protein FOF60_04795 [Mesobacillus jeotgali]